MKKCLRQFMRPSRPLPIEGVGDCTICKTDEKNNKKCRLYVPINVTTIEVEKDE